MAVVYTALVTPFNSDGSVDLTTFEKNLDAQAAAGVDGVLVCGSTGEGITLSEDEKELLLKTTVKRVGQHMVVLMNAGHVDTREAVRWQGKSKDLGAVSTVHVTPWYNRPTPEGLYAHFARIAEVNDLPMIIYNNPGRTACDMSAELIIELASKFKNIVGVKECNLNPIRLHTLLENAPAGFKLYSGEDSFVLPLMAMGGHGVISVWSNLVPKLFVELVKNPTPALAAKLAFLSNVTSRPNPISIKTAMGLNEFRLPLLGLERAECEELLTRVKELLKTQQ
ncbi:MAG: 4-hydroxy-tetrahydrodipicolinate synthase [Myxococcota bacterium]